MGEFDKRNFADLPTVRELRKEARMSAFDVAVMTGVKNDHTVYNWEKKGTLPSVEQAFRIAALFNRRVDEINWWPALTS